MKAVVLLAHGSGAGHTHPRMKGWADRLAAHVHVAPLTYPYMAAGRRFPDKMPVLEAAHLAAARQLCETHPDHALVLVGHSLGGRVGLRVLEQTQAVAAVALSYPLVSSGKAAKRRTDTLLAVRRPVLIVHGTRDKMVPVDELQAAAAAHPTQALSLHEVPDGDHSLLSRKRPLKAAGLVQDDLDNAVIKSIVAFIAEQIPCA